MRRERLRAEHACARPRALGEQLEGDDLDVDVLAERVRRASELIKVCRTRISRASADVERIVADLDSFETSSDGDGDESAETEPDD